ncbi:hypothetical protein I7I48_11816 [Histoplasma ohiense]|nr:hypothetical protein I7I48_11816 [Histoplasma ohiense (nom. inval.)]
MPNSLLRTDSALNAFAPKPLPLETERGKAPTLSSYSLGNEYGPHGSRKWNPTLNRMPWFNCQRLTEVGYVSIQATLPTSQKRPNFQNWTRQTGNNPQVSYIWTSMMIKWNKFFP